MFEWVLLCITELYTVFLEVWDFSSCKMPFFSVGEKQQSIRRAADNSRLNPSKPAPEIKEKCNHNKNDQIPWFMSLPMQRWSSRTTSRDQQLNQQRRRGALGYWQSARTQRGSHDRDWASYYTHHTTETDHADRPTRQQKQFHSDEFTYTHRLKHIDTDENSSKVQRLRQMRIGNICFTYLCV